MSGKRHGLSKEARDLAERALTGPDDTEARKLAAVVEDHKAKKARAVRGADDTIARGNARGAACKRGREKR